MTRSAYAHKGADERSDVSLHEGVARPVARLRWLGDVLPELIRLLSEVWRPYSKAISHSSCQVGEEATSRRRLCACGSPVAQRPCCVAA